MEIMNEISEYAALTAQIADLQAKADAMHHRIKQRAAAAVRAIMAEHGLTPQHLLQGSGKPPKPSTNAGYPNKVMAPRYRNPVDGKTWSGIGRAPGWIAKAPDRAVFRI
jgi:DNA-binding protein H-NS